MPTQSESPAAVSGTSHEDASIAAKATPPTVAGHARPGDLPCGRRRGSCNLVADEPERAAGHRRSVRCRGVPGFQHSRRSECLHISSASGGKCSRPLLPVSSLTWSQADPKSREWVEANRQAIELFQQGADQSDAANPDGDSVVNGQRMALLVLLEADRRQASGDMAGAWDCYRAILRMATHTRRRGSLNQRVDLYVYWDGLSRQRLATWAADPRTSIPQLHGALEEVLKSEPRPEWDSFAMKSGYLAMMRFAGAAGPYLRSAGCRLGISLIALVTCSCRPIWSVISMPGAVSSCASPNAAGASCNCSMPTGWRTWKPMSHGNRPFGLCSLC